MQKIARGFVAFPSKNSASRFTLSRTPKVFIEITKLLRGSNIQWRGRSYAASVPSDAPKARRGQKRVSKDERKAMVGSFVSKYRATNAGKFPTASVAQKEVGGSYYVVKKIIQELQYNYKFSSLNKRNENPLVKEVTKENESLIEVEEVSSSQRTADAEIQNGSQNVEVRGALKTFTWVEKTSASSKEVGKSQTEGDDFDFVATQSHLQEKDALDISQPSFLKTEDDIKEKAATEDSLDFGGPKHETKHDQGSLKLENVARNISGKQTNDEEQHKSSTIWGNLKSFADGIINIWRKL